MSLVVIGMDPHKRSATIEIMAGDKAILGGRRYATDVAGVPAMLAAVKQWPERVWAIEGCLGIGRHLGEPAAGTASRRSTPRPAARSAIAYPGRQPPGQPRLHIMAVIQLRNPTEGRACYDRKVAARKTPREALRAPQTAGCPTSPAAR
jgi:hypothetical protein